MAFAAPVGAVALAVSLAVLAASGPAGAAPKRITGTLTKPGYTVIALAASGKARSVRTRQGRFTLVPPARTVTLHLRAANGKYAGPIVVGSRLRGRRAIVGLRAGARLGIIRVRVGYARVTHRLPTQAVNTRRLARASRGVPIGARVFGRVRSRPPRLAPAGDRDFDGIPGPLDIDDDGDLILDNVDRSGVAKASRAARHVGPDGFGVHSYMALTLDQTVNANAAAVTDAQVDAAVSSYSLLTLIFRLGGAAELASAELDCGRPQSPTNPRGGGLVYCSTGGTGRVLKPGGSPSDLLEFPECCDSDGDGLGTLQPNPGSSNAMNLIHGATTAQIGTGDVLIERVNTGALDPPPDSVQYIFATVPALVSYSDGQGNSGTVSYPVTPGSTAFSVAAGPNGDVIVTLSFWRPQRRPIGTGPNKEACLKDSPPCEWIDIGHLEYGVAPGPRDGCPQSTLSTSDPSLTPAPPAPSGAGGFTDLADDRPASPTNTFTYTLNLTQCLASRGLSFNSGEVQGFAFGGTSNGDSTFQLVLFKRQ